MDRAKAMIARIQDRKSSRWAEDEKKLRKAHTVRLESIKPQEWNNIPIPVSEAFITLVSSAKNIYDNVYEHEKNLGELLAIAQNMNYNYFNAMIDDLKLRVQ